MILQSKITKIIVDIDRIICLLSSKGIGLYPKNKGPKWVSYLIEQCDPGPHFRCDYPSQLLLLFCLELQRGNKSVPLICDRS